MTERRGVGGQDSYFFNWIVWVMVLENCTLILMNICIRRVMKMITSIMLMMITVTTTLSRHGESEWNQQNRFCGWFDANLSDTGVKVLPSPNNIILSSFSQYILLPFFLLKFLSSFLLSFSQLCTPSSFSSILCSFLKTV